MSKRRHHVAAPKGARPGTPSQPDAPQDPVTTPDDVVVDVDDDIDDESEASDDQAETTEHQDDAETGAPDAPGPGVPTEANQRAPVRGGLATELGQAATQVLNQALAEGATRGDVDGFAGFLRPAIDAAIAERILLEEACDALGIAPECIMSRVAFTPATDDAPERIRFVTAGGFKVCWPPDEDMRTRLRRAYELSAGDALPAARPLPEPLVTGHAAGTSHQFPGGYLRRKS